MPSIMVQDSQPPSLINVNTTSEPGLNLRLFVSTLATIISLEFCTGYENIWQI